MDTVNINGGRVERVKCSSVQGRAEAFWWNNKDVAKLGAETIASPYEEMQKLWMNTLWVLVYSKKDIQAFRMAFFFFFPSKRRYWEKLPLGCLWLWFLSACPPSCSISGLYMQVPGGNSTPQFRSLLRVLNNLVIDCFLDSLPIACNVKYWKWM